MKNETGEKNEIAWQTPFLRLLPLKYLIQNLLYQMPQLQ